MAGGRHAESNLYEGPGSSGYLCTGCLEKRIGRQLSKRHFTAVPINDPLDPWNTPRLADRLSRRRLPYLFATIARKSDSPTNEQLPSGVRLNGGTAVPISRLHLRIEARSANDVR